LVTWLVSTGLSIILKMVYYNSNGSNGVKKKVLTGCFWTCNLRINAS